jgi:sugar phosphate isomerase/epimerase
VTALSAAKKLHPRLSVSSVCSFSWDLDQDLRLWADAGVDRVGIAYVTLEAGGLAASVQKVADAGLEVCDLIGVGPFRLDDPSSWQEQQEELLPVIDAAAALGAGSLIFTPGPAGALSWEEAAAAFTEAFMPVADAAHQRGVRLAIENTGWLRFEIGFATTLRDTVDLARSLDAGLCVEINNCWIERGLQRTLADAAPNITVFQLSDYVEGTNNSPNRAVPGDGMIPLRRIVSQVLDAGYEGPFELEILGPRIDDEGVEAAITRGIAALEELLVSIGVPG